MRGAHSGPTRWPWLYRPEWYRCGWSPVFIGNDEFGRMTLMLGWPVTGRIIIPLWQEALT